MTKTGKSAGGEATRSREVSPRAAGFSGSVTPSPELTAKLEPRKGPVKVALNTRVLASTEVRLNWLVKNREFTVTNVVDVALQEFFDRYGVPPVGPDGRIAGPES